MLFLLVSQSFTLPAPPVISPMDDLTVIEGTTATLTCQATGNPLPNVSWKFGGQEYAGQVVSSWLFMFIIHQIFSLARDWWNRDT